MQDFHWLVLALVVIAVLRRLFGISTTPTPESAPRFQPRWRTLEQAMAQPGDNLLLLRLLAAAAVIYGHSYAICGIAGASDHIARQGWGYGLYSGSIAVQVFFLISGFLVTAAWLRRPDPGFFLASRCLRVLPGYLACLVLSALVLGALLTELPLGEYYANPDTWGYIHRNAALATGMAWTLPGVFTDNPLRNTVNGSIWTLAVEVRVYVWLAAFGLLGLLDRRERLLYATLLLVVALQTAFPLPLMPIDEYTRLGAFFLAGSLFYRWRALIPFHGALLLPLAVLTVLAHGGAWFLPLYGLTLAYATFWFAYGPRWLLAYNRCGDYSYGVYLWGFPLQQLVAQLLPVPTPTRITLLALPLALIAGVLSWHLLEQPALKLKRWFGRAAPASGSGTPASAMPAPGPASAG